MTTIAEQFGMTEALKQLGIQPVNVGNSTGNHHFSNGELLESFSPVDGKLIAKLFRYCCHFVLLFLFLKKVKILFTIYFFR